jgi:hypothetical protein
LTGKFHSQRQPDISQPQHADMKRTILDFLQQAIQGHFTGIPSVYSDLQYNYGDKKKQSKTAFLALFDCLLKLKTQNLRNRNQASTALGNM